MPTLIPQNGCFQLSTTKLVPFAKKLLHWTKRNNHKPCPNHLDFCQDLEFHQTSTRQPQCPGWTAPRLLLPVVVRCKNSPKTTATTPTFPDRCVRARRHDRFLLSRTEGLWNWRFVVCRFEWKNSILVFVFKFWRFSPTPFKPSCAKRERLSHPIWF